ncbi:hypothetical protein HHK36_016759 [Tetracentron sinense]|uniref:Uncharacterized protein n=1 Tax=Tetracentron sinense TaxID=13715 RepID=A0A835DEZ2_TETSI|nr:hypothetical protein HHK36_016759 [Tetracentron sinense]
MGIKVPEMMSDEDEKVEGTRKHKVEKKEEKVGEQKKAKRAKSEIKSENGGGNGKKATEEFEEFCRATREHLSMEQIREILEANGQPMMLLFLDGHQDMLFYGPLEKCPLCNGNMECTGSYSCRSPCSEWSSCTFNTREPHRRKDAIKLPDSIMNSAISDGSFESRHTEVLGVMEAKVSGEVKEVSTEVGIEVNEMPAEVRQVAVGMSWRQCDHQGHHERSWKDCQSLSNHEIGRTPRPLVE